MKTECMCYVTYGGALLRECTRIEVMWRKYLKKKLKYLNSFIFRTQRRAEPLLRRDLGSNARNVA
jgi:hypothetical protein